MKETATRRPSRFDRVDALRGAAIVWMAAFHFCFDLNYFGFIRQNFYLDPFWTVQRACIVTLFMACVGAGQAIASAQHQPWQRFWRRWAQVAGCASPPRSLTSPCGLRSRASPGRWHGAGRAS